MRRFAPALALVAVLILGGTAQAAPVRTEIVATPAAGTEAVARKGEPVASTSEMEAIDAIITKEAYTGGGLTVPPGRLSLWRSYPDGRLYQAFGSLHRDAPPGESTVVIGGVFVPKDLGKSPQLYRMDYVLGPVFYDAPGIVFTETVYQRSTLGSTRRDLVFTGLSEGKAGFLLREFEGDMVRPARTEAVSLSATPGAELQPGGARIRVVALNDDELRYVLLAPLDPVVVAPQIIPDPPEPEEDEAEPPPIRRPPGPGQSI